VTTLNVVVFFHYMIAVGFYSLRIRQTSSIFKAKKQIFAEEMDSAQVDKR